MLIINPNGSQPSASGPADYFTGTVRVDAPFKGTDDARVSGVYQLLEAALDGFGLSYIPHDVVAPYLKSGHLVQVLEDWSPQFAGFHLYYPSRRQASPAFALLVEALRYRG